MYSNFSLFLIIELQLSGAIHGFKTIEFATLFIIGTTTGQNNILRLELYSLHHSLHVFQFLAPPFFVIL